MTAIELMRKDARFLAIDSASHSYAFSVIDRTKSGLKLVSRGKVEFKKDMESKIERITSTLPVLIESLHPTHMVIEETIYIQNANTTRILAYVVGSLWATGQVCGVKNIQDVGPLVWKRDLGYKRVMPAEKKQWAAELGKTEANKKAAFERKDRVRQIIAKRLPGVNLEDEDMMDAVAIGIWAAENVT